MVTAVYPPKPPSNWNEERPFKAIIMQADELIIEMKILEDRLRLFEEKYGILSAEFYSALVSGQLEQYDEDDEARADFSRWKGIYETWQRRKQKAGGDL